MKGRAISYSAAELAWVEARAGTGRAQAHQAFVARFGRADVSLANFCALCKRRVWPGSGSGRFQKGQPSPTKGRPMSAETRAKCERTMFKKGSLRGNALNQQKPIGSERVTRDGYLERKIHNGLPMQSRWRAVHQIRWEEANGPLPAGHALKCLDGDRRNTAPSNWTAIPRAMLPRLNGRFGRDYDAAPAELKPTIMAVAELEHMVRTRKREGAA